MATSATTTAAVFSSFSNSHISGRGRRLGQGGTNHPLNSHGATISIPGNHQQRKRRRRQRKAAAAAERQKSETMQESRAVIMNSKSNNHEDYQVIDMVANKNLLQKGVANPCTGGSSVCQNGCTCDDVSASLLASLVASTEEKQTNSSPKIFNSPKMGPVSCINDNNFIPKFAIDNSKVMTYSYSSAPLFGKPQVVDVNTSDAGAHSEATRSKLTDHNSCNEPLTQSVQSNGYLSRVPPLINSPELQLRFLNPSDIPEVKRLCKEWFPIEYPDVWYTDITSNHKFYSVCAIYRSQIIGLIVAEIKEKGNLPKEDSEILAPDNICPSFLGRGNGRKSNQRLGYILSLGVVKEFRKNGIASFLLDNLVAHITNPYNDPPTDDVRALYLHVLTTNSQAIAFYEHRGFRAHLFLPYYYAIKGRRRDGFTYVLYLNGGHPPWTLLDYAGHCLQATFYGIVTLQPVRRWLNLPVFLTRSLLRKLTGAAFAAAGGGGGNQRLAAAGGGVGYAINGANGGQGVWPRIRQIAHSSTAAVFTS